MSTGDIVTALAAHFQVQSVLHLLSQGHYFDNTIDDGVRETVNHSPADPFVSWYTSDMDLHRDSAALVVCHETLLCREAFESMDRSSVVFALIDLEPTAVMGNTARLDDTIVSFNAASDELREWYGVQGKARSIPFATWNGEKLIMSKNAQLPIWDRRVNLGGAALRATVALWEPINIKIPDPNGGDSFKWSGAFIEIMETLQPALNFTLTYSSPADNQWGQKVTVTNETGTYEHWTGMVGEVVYGRADICLGGLSISKERSDVIDFSRRIVEFTYTALKRNHRHRDFEDGSPSLDFYAFLTVFRPKAWAGLGVMCLAFALAICVLVAFKRKKFNFPTPIKFVSPSMWGASMYGLSLIQLNYFRGIGELRWSSHLAQLFVSIYGFFIFTVYSSDLTATMTAGGSLKLPTSFSDILEEGFSLYMLKGTLQHSVLSTADPETPMRKVYDDNVIMEDWPADGNLEPLIQKIVADKYTLFFGNYLDFFKDDRLVVIEEFKESIKSGIHIAYTKDAEFTHLFNYHIDKLYQTGNLDNILHKWLELDKPYDNSDRIFVEEARAIGIWDLMLPSSLLLAAASVSAALVAYEVATKKYKEHESDIASRVSWYNVKPLY